MRPHQLLADLVGLAVELEQTRAQRLCALPACSSSLIALYWRNWSSEALMSSASISDSERSPLLSPGFGGPLALRSGRLESTSDHSAPCSATRSYSSKLKSGGGSTMSTHRRSDHP
jgi:hypothetical protein